MNSAVQYLLWGMGGTLLILVLSSLLQGAYKKFPFIFIYTLALFLATVVEVASLLDKGFTQAATRYYWINDVILEFLVFCIVISLIYLSMENYAHKSVIRRWLIPAAATIAIASLYVHRAPGGFWNASTKELTKWMTSVSRDLSFTAVVLDLLLWSVLIAVKKKDVQLLMLSGGLGIEFTGTAIGQSLRQMSRSTVFIGGIIMVVSHLVCLYAWWQALRVPAAQKKPLAANSTPGK